MRACFICFEIKNYKEFSFNKSKNIYETKCKKCKNKIYHKKVHALGKSLKQRMDKLYKKYEAIIEFKKKNPSVALSYICNMNSISVEAFRSWIDYHNISIISCGSRKLENINYPSDKWYAWPKAKESAKARYQIPHVKARVRLQNKEWILKNRDLNLFYKRRWAKKCTDRLDDSYIRNTILHKRSFLKGKDFPQNLVDATRERIKLLRIIKQHEKNN